MVTLVQSYKHGSAPTSDYALLFLRDFAKKMKVLQIHSFKKKYRKAYMKK